MKNYPYQLTWFVSLGLLSAITLSNCGRQNATTTTVTESPGEVQLMVHINAINAMLKTAYAKGASKNLSAARAATKLDATTTAAVVLLNLSAETNAIIAQTNTYNSEASLTDYGTVMAWFVQNLSAVAAQVPQLIASFNSLSSSSQQAYLSLISGTSNYSSSSTGAAILAEYASGKITPAAH
jgi:hypothetical protein